MPRYTCAVELRPNSSTPTQCPQSNLTEAALQAEFRCGVQAAVVSLVKGRRISIRHAARQLKMAVNSSTGLGHSQAGSRPVASVG